MCEPLPGRAAADVPPVPAPLLPLQSPGSLQLSAPRPGLPAPPAAPAAGRDDALLLPPDDAVPADPAVAPGDVGHGGVLPAAPRHVDVARQAEPQCGAGQPGLQCQ